MHYQGSTIIETSRLQLVCCNTEILETLFKGDQELAILLGVNIPGNWTVYGEPAFRWTYEHLAKPGAQPEWWSYLPIIKEENMLAGSCGFKGEPVNGMVEIGYEVAQSRRRMGYATEIARALIEKSFTAPHVSCVQAHTLAEKNESGTVLTNCGMRWIEEIIDPEDGKIWRWEIRK